MIDVGSDDMCTQNDLEKILKKIVIIYRSEFETYKDILPYYRNIAQEGVKLSA